MYIARLQLKDFKSFGGAHELPLTPGMTAIVGPNGSGKSNILDSLRWVLGDSHSTKLRVVKQDGLIFHGSASRERASEALVSIQLREGTRVCTVRRKVSEAGAVVAVDGSRVTLAELDDVKRAWQLGGDKFAFIGQGDVAEVIQQRPQARRILLESLFGIDSYKKRREEASTRLADAREEYLRLRTFSAELKARYDEIAPEVERARAARDLLDALDGYRRSYYWARRAANEALAAGNDARMACLAQASKMKEAWLGVWDSSVSRIDAAIAALSNTRQLQIRELDGAKDAISGFTRTAYGYGAALTSALRRSSRIKEERAALAEKLDGLKAEGEKFSSEEKSLREELEAGKKSLAESEEKHRALEEKTRLAREKTERANRERGEAEGEMSALRGRIKSIGASLREHNKRGGDQTSAPDPLKAVKKEMDALERRHGELLDEQEKTASLHRDLYAKLQGASSDLQRNRRELSKMSNRLAELQEQAATEVYPAHVRHVTSAVKLGRLKANLRVAIDAFQCPTEYAAAFEGFLGGRQFWIFADTMDEVGACIDLLKKNQAGRATFLPLERSKPRSRDRSYRLPSDGIVGWAMDLIKSEEHWRPALEHIMGDLLIADAYAVGQALVRGGFRGPVATLDGDVFQPGGTISGGRSQKPGRAMEIMGAISRLESETEAARRLVDSLTAGFGKLEEDEAAAAAKKEEISLEIRELASRRSSCDAHREEILRERARAKSERESLMASLKECGASYARLAARLKALDSEIGESAPEADMGMVKEIERLKSKVAIAEEKMRSGFVLAERMATETRSVTRAISDLDAELSSCDREAMANRSNLASLSKRVGEAVRRRRAALAEMAEFKERYEAITRQRDRRMARLEAARNAVREAASAANAANIEKAELSRERAEIIQTWEEQYPYPGPDAVGDESTDDLRRAIRECDRSVKAMGDVDMGVLSEERSLRDRLAYMGEQLDDVGEGMRELERLISEADEQARTIFTRALEEIDKKFNALFQRLFTGGDARLEMIEGESLWDSGVDVVARPPGKHPTSIAQLSGGEQSLSAIALLFSSLEVASCPIAVLDEVDAALDEVNLRRFADLAKDASKERQIFVMTHRRLTMERADVLYGVTLAEPGLSQVIGVRVEDWA